MTASGVTLEPLLLDVLGELGLEPGLAPSQADWEAFLWSVSERLGRSTHVGGSHPAFPIDRAASVERAFIGFFSTMNHELRTPVAVILGCLELLGDSIGEGHGTLAAARSAALELIGRIDEILEYSRLESGDLELTSRPFELERLVSDVLARQRPKAHARGIALEYHSNVAQECWLLGDAHRLEQVLNALLDNALKFTERGFVRVEVREEETDANGSQIGFFVVDTGQGIPLEAFDGILAPFRQIDVTPSRRHGGIGLGLSLAHKLIAALGGRLEVSSTLGRGSEFSFVLCFPKPGADELCLQRPRIVRGHSPRVLVAEDNEFNRAFIVRSLEPLGYDVRAVPNGRALLSSIGEFVPDLVLMDVQMPEMDGLTAARHIRALPEPCASVPIIALTANSEHADRGSYEAAGMDELLPKPISTEALRGAVARWLELLPEVASEGDPAPATIRTYDESSLFEDTLTESLPIDVLFGDADGALDLERIEELVHQAGSFEILRELAEIFLDDTQERLVGLRRAFASGEQQEARRLAHALRGAAANFGALEVARCAEQIERAGAGTPRVDDLSSIERAFERVRSLITPALLDSNAGSSRTQQTA